MLRARTEHIAISQTQRLGLEGCNYKQLLGAAKPNYELKFECFATRIHFAKQPHGQDVNFRNYHITLAGSLQHEAL